MANLSEKQLVPRIFVGGVGLILLGIGIGGLASLPPTMAVSTCPAMVPVMGTGMMNWMMPPFQGGAFAPGVAPFGTNAAINAYLGVMIGIYAGLIAVGGYLIYRVVAPAIRLSAQSAA